MSEPGGGPPPKPTGPEAEAGTGISERAGPAGELPEGLPAGLLEGVLAADRLSVARALTAVEAEPGGPLAAALYRRGGRAHVVGVTGAPGVGKSTLVAAMVTAWRALGRRVGVVAVDPSSPLSGGALLGDRLRMEQHLGDPGVFIRSLASRGDAGGLAEAAAGAVTVLDAAGYDPVILETVGAGQGEVRLAEECHTVVVVLAPGGGDEVQAQKAGILELGDLFVVNKADLDGAATTAASLAAGLHLASPRDPGWAPPVLRASAVEGSGVPELVAAVDAHAGHLRQGGGWQGREARRAAAALARQLYRRLVAPQLARVRSGAADAGVVAELVARLSDPRLAAEELLAPRGGSQDGQRGGSAAGGAQQAAAENRRASAEALPVEPGR
jgi:LAO/AO transport system kinase